MFGMDLNQMVEPGLSYHFSNMVKKVIFQHFAEHCPFNTDINDLTLVISY